jgi:O-antigen ligase
MIDPEKRKHVHRRIFYYLVLSIAFFIPIYGRILPPLIFFLFLNWLIEGSYIKTLPMIWKEKKRSAVFAFSFLYLLYLVGLSYSSNMDYGWFDLEVKLALLIFPLVFATSEFPVFARQEAGTVLKVFVAGCISGSILLLGRACYNSVFLHQPGAFYYSGLSWSYHPGYYSMYLAFALSNILYFLLIRQTIKGPGQLSAHILFLLLFTVMIVLLSSKAGLLIWVAVIVFYTLLLFFRYKRWLYGTIFIAAASAVFILFLLLFPNAAGRVSQARQDMATSDTIGNASRSTGERVVIWKASMEIIKNNFLFGVGTGDVKDKLMEEYRKANASNVWETKRNAHNQYVQTFIAIGITGLLLLLAIFAVPAFLSFKQGSYIYFTFLFITGISMFFESMFETQAGVVFYALFNVLLYTSYQSDPFNNPFEVPVRKV